MVSRLIRTRFGALAMPSTLKRGQLAELEAADVDAIVAAAGLRSQPPRSGPRPKPRHARTDSPKSLKAPGGRRPPGPPKSRPHGARTSFQGQPRPAGSAMGALPGEAPAATQEGAPQRPAQQHPKKPRAWKNRGGAGKPTHPGAAQPPQHDPRRKPTKSNAKGQRAPRPRHNFDEVQPQSNANASPFGRNTLTAPGGTPRGFGNEAAPRHRSGPRAQKAGNGNGHARNQAGAAQFNDRRDPLEPVYKAPSQPVTQTQIRSKRTRTIVAADIAADADGSPALRRLLNGRKS